MTMIRTHRSTAPPVTRHAPAPHHAARRRAPAAHDPRRALAKTAWNLLGLAVAVVMIFPVYWMISSSFKTGINLRRVDPQWFPQPVHLRFLQPRTRPAAVPGQPGQQSVWWSPRPR